MTENYKEHLELSPESLKKRYANAEKPISSISPKDKKSRSRLLSPQSNKKESENVIMLEADVSQFMNKFKNQNDYLRSIIYNLDMKMRVIDFK